MLGLFSLPVPLGLLCIVAMINAKGLEAAGRSRNCAVDRDLTPAGGSQPGRGARQFGQQQEALNSLSFTDTLIVLRNLRGLEDSSFQLSILADLDLVLYAGPLSNGSSTWIGRSLPTPATGGWQWSSMTACC